MEENLRQLFAKTQPEAKNGPKAKTKRLVEKIEKADREYAETMKIQQALKEAFANFPKEKLAGRKKKSLL